MWGSTDKTKPHSNSSIDIRDELQLGFLKLRIISPFLTAP
ncbi:hypothetical protein VCSRO62_2982 [Vibrio cholerae]|nr:hypothetical protein VCSRO62_2982 [Vibrio cholerae]